MASRRAKTRFDSRAAEEHRFWQAESWSLMVNIRFTRGGNFRIGSEEATQTKPFLLRTLGSKPGLTRLWGRRQPRRGAPQRLEHLKSPLRRSPSAQRRTALDPLCPLRPALSTAGPQCHQSSRARARAAGSLGSSDDESNEAARPQRCPSATLLTQIARSRANRARCRAEAIRRASTSVGDLRHFSPRLRRPSSVRRERPGACRE